MLEYWQNLQAREQRTLIAGAIALTLILIYSLVIDPFSSELQRLKRGVAENRELLQWMEQAAQQAKGLQQAGGARRNSGQSLLSLVDSSAKRNGLGGALKQLRPEGEGVRLRFEQAGFDDMVRWLGRLGKEQGVAVTSLTLERLELPGKVNATVVLERG